MTACPIDSAVDAARAKGFTVTGHEVRIYGLCRECSQAPAAPPVDAEGAACTEGATG